MKSYIEIFQSGGDTKYVSKIKDIRGNETGGGFRWSDDLIALSKMKDAFLNFKNKLTKYANVQKNLPKLNEGSSSTFNPKIVDVIQLRYNNESYPGIPYNFVYSNLRTTSRL